MAAPNTLGKLCSSFGQMEVGDYIKCAYIAPLENVSGEYVQLGSLAPTYTYQKTEDGVSSDIQTVEFSELPEDTPAEKGIAGYTYFIKAAKGKLISDRNIQLNISWEALNKKNFIFGGIRDAAHMNVTVTDVVTNYDKREKTDNDPSTTYSWSIRYQEGTLSGSGNDMLVTLNGINNLNFFDTPFATIGATSTYSEDNPTEKNVVEYTVIQNIFSTETQTDPEDETKTVSINCITQKKIVRTIRIVTDSLEEGDFKEKVLIGVLSGDEIVKLINENTMSGNISTPGAKDVWHSPEYYTGAAKCFYKWSRARPSEMIFPNTHVDVIRANGGSGEVGSDFLNTTVYTEYGIYGSSSQNVNMVFNFPITSDSMNGSEIKTAYNQKTSTFVGFRLYSDSFGYIREQTDFVATKSSSFVKYKYYQIHIDSYGSPAYARISLYTNLYYRPFMQYVDNSYSVSLFY